MESVTDQVDAEISDLQARTRHQRIVRALAIAGIIAIVVIESLIIYALVVNIDTISSDPESGATVLFPLALYGGIGAVIGIATLGARVIDARESLARLRFSLDRAREERKRLLAGGSTSRLSVLNRYKNDLPEVVESLRLMARRYRKRHNWLQSVVILGSLGASAVVALLGESQPGRILAVAISTVVTISAAYSGYFRYKEKSISLQGTADEIEQEHRAVHLGIGVYQGKTPIETLQLFAERVEALRTNQQRQALELDQQVQIEYQPGPAHDIQ